jgi:hypothetical protein
MLGLVLQSKVLMVFPEKTLVGEYFGVRTFKLRAGLITQEQVNLNYSTVQEEL